MGRGSQAGRRHLALVFAVGLAVAVPGAGPVGAATMAPGDAPIDAVVQFDSLPPGPAWSPIRRVATNVDISPGGTIARTIGVEHNWLHAVYWKKNVLYRRSKDGGATWGAAKALTDTVQLLGRPSVATSGSYVHVAWARRVIDQLTEQPGVAIFVRSNPHHGRADAWNRVVRLTPRSGEVRAPAIAVSGATVYVAFSDLREDVTRLMISRDNGATWISKTVGSGYEEDFEGVPVAVPIVAAAGDNVMVAWLAAGGVATARVSTDRGRHFSAPVALGDGLSSAAALKGRIALTGSAYGEAWVRIWKDGTWGPSRALPDLMLGADTANLVSPDVVLRKGGRVGVVLSAQVDLDEDLSREEITWLK